MTTGTSIERIEKEILSIKRRIPEISEVFGFGSFFRAEMHNDIDVLFVVDCARTSLLNVAKSIRTEIKELSFALNQPIDPLILTIEEFAEQPLRDMSELRRLAAKGGYSNDVMGGHKSQEALSTERVRRPD